MRKAIMGAALALLMVAGAAPALAADEEAAEPKETQQLDFIDWLMALKPVDKEELAVLDAACEGGGDVMPDPQSCGEAGDLYKHQFDYVSRAKPYYSKACEGGLLDYCNELGKLHARAEEHDQAYAVFDAACQKGSAKSCSNVAYSKYHGLGTEKDVPAARAEWFEVCDQDMIMAACHNYAGLVKSGEGSDEPANPAFAKEIYSRACDEGYRASCKMLEDQGAASD